MSPRLAVQLRLDDGMVVDLGRQQPKVPVRLRLQRSSSILPGGAFGRETAAVGGYAVSERICAAVAAGARSLKSNEQRRKDLIVGLDIGTSKIVALVAEVSPEGRLNVIGIGSRRSRRV